VTYKDPSGLNAGHCICGEGGNWKYEMSTLVNPDGSEKWRFNAKASVSGGVAVDDAGSIYVSARNLYALSPEGALRWKLASTTGRLRQ
jgi:outer membrane protein assembly factor BamB